MWKIVGCSGGAAGAFARRFTPGSASLLWKNRRKSSMVLLVGPAVPAESGLAGTLGREPHGKPVERVAEVFDVDAEPLGDDSPRSRGVVLGVVTLGGVLVHMRQRRVDAESRADVLPVGLKRFKLADVIGDHVPVRVHEPIQLIPVRHRVQTRAAAELNPLHEVIKRHLVAQLHSLAALVERNGSVPRIADEPELEVTLELL